MSDDSGAGAAKDAHNTSGASSSRLRLILSIVSCCVAGVLGVEVVADMVVVRGKEVMVVVRCGLDLTLNAARGGFEGKSDFGDPNAADY